MSDAITSPVTVRIPEAVRISGIGRSSLYVLIRDGKIKSHVLKSRKDSEKGIRLINFESLKAFCEGGDQ